MKLMTPSSLNSLGTAELGWKSKKSPDCNLPQHLHHQGEINFMTPCFLLENNHFENRDYSILVILKYRHLESFY